MDYLSQLYRRRIAELEKQIEYLLARLAELEKSADEDDWGSCD